MKLWFSQQINQIAHMEEERRRGTNSREAEEMAVFCIVVTFWREHCIPKQLKNRKSSLLEKKKHFLKTTVVLDRHCLDELHILIIMRLVVFQQENVLVVFWGEQTGQQVPIFWPQIMSWLLQTINSEIHWKMWILGMLMSKSTLKIQLCLDLFFLYI